jgi:hypothetical protein
MKILFYGLLALSVCAGFSPRTSAQTVTITVGPAVDDSYWVWNEEYRCWVWTGPEFQGEYQGHPYSYWHSRHEGDDREHRPHRIEQQQPVRQEEQRVEQPKVEGQQQQPKVEVEQPQQHKEAEHQQQVEQPNQQQHKEGDKAQEHPKVEKAKVEHKEEKAKDEKNEQKPQ